MERLDFDAFRDRLKGKTIRDLLAMVPELDLDPRLTRAELLQALHAHCFPDGAAAAPSAPIAPTPALEQAAPSGTIYSVRSRATVGRWRCGRHFTPIRVMIAESELTQAEWAKLRSDPVLEIRKA